MSLELDELKKLAENLKSATANTIASHADALQRHELLLHEALEAFKIISDMVHRHEATLIALDQEIRRRMGEPGAPPPTPGMN